MARLKSTMVVFMLIMVASFQLQSTLAQTRHVVGDALGWTIPPNGEATYTTWTSQQTFRVGDTLFFNFTTGLHNVAEISEAVYAPCTTTNTLTLNPTGPATITLTRSGPHYFICTVVSHCQIGQKLTVNVSPATGTTPGSTPLSPPSTIANPPSTFEQSPTGSPVVPPSPSASSALIVMVPVTFLVIALTSFY